MNQSERVCRVCGDLCVCAFCGVEPRSKTTASQEPGAGAKPRV